MLVIDERGPTDWGVKGLPIDERRFFCIWQDTTIKGHQNPLAPTINPTTLV